MPDHVEIHDESLEKCVRSYMDTHRSDRLKETAEITSRVVEQLLTKRQRDIEDSCVETAIKRVKLDKPEQFKSKSIENQHRHQLEIQQCVDDAIRQLEEGEQDAASTSLQQGKKLISGRIKMLKLADREGWGAVNAYLTDNIADDAEDEKRIRKAVKHAKEAALSSKKPATASHRSAPRRVDSTRSYSRRNNGISAEKFFPGATNRPRFGGAKVCFHCGMEGHIIKNCFKRKNGGLRKDRY